MSRALRVTAATRGIVLIVLSSAGLVGCGEQRVVFFDGTGPTGPDGGPADSSVTMLALDASSRDPEQCGAAAVHCEDDEYCVDGLCVCRQGLTRIEESCVDTESDTDHCGREGLSCPDACAAGACVPSCPDTTTDCEGACVDLSDHPLHCGECERPCGSGRLCVAGACVPFRPATCTSCPCDLCGTRSCCDYPGTTDPVCLDGPTCPPPAP